VRLTRFSPGWAGGRAHHTSRERRACLSCAGDERS